MRRALISWTSWILTRDTFEFIGLEGKAHVEYGLGMALGVKGFRAVHTIPDQAWSNAVMVQDTDFHWNRKNPFHFVVIRSIQLLCGAASNSRTRSV